MGGLTVRVVALIQARLGSTRLPKKVLMDLNGRPMLMHPVERARASSRVDHVAVAMTTDPTDDPLEAYCDEAAIASYRGSVDDLVGRLLGAAHASHADVIVRIWGDCPMVDPKVIDQAVEALVDRGADFATNGLLAGRTYPVGLDIEVYRVSLLERIAAETDHPFLREVPIEFVREHASDLQVEFLTHDEDLSDVHLTVDYPEDLERFRAMLIALESNDELVDFRDAVVWVRRHLSEDVAHARDADYTEKRDRYLEEER